MPRQRAACAKRGRKMMQAITLTRARELYSDVPVPVRRSLSLRTCCRCGGEFEASQRQIVCPACKAKAKPQHLTPREKQVCRLVAEGKPNKEIAYALHLSEGTVKEYLFRIFRKTGVTNRTELAIWQLRNAGEISATEEKPCA